MPSVLGVFDEPGSVAAALASLPESPGDPASAESEDERSPAASAACLWLACAVLSPCPGACPLSGCCSADCEASERPSPSALGLDSCAVCSSLA